MNADNFRHAYDYHFTVNRRIWDKSIMTLTDEQFLKDSSYSIGSVRDQTVHMMSVEQRWFSELRGLDVPDYLDPQDFPDRVSVRTAWDKTENDLRAYLDTLGDDDLQKPFDGPFYVWQVLFHNLNHGTDHRAQLLAMLDGMGAPTFAQDYAYYVIGIDPSVPKEKR